MKQPSENKQATGREGASPRLNPGTFEKPRRQHSGKLLILRGGNLPIQRFGIHLFAERCSTMLQVCRSQGAFPALQWAETSFISGS